MVPLMASLKVGVTKQVAQSLLASRSDHEKYHEDQSESMVSNMRGFCKKTWKTDKTLSQTLSCLMMTESDQKMFFYSLERLIFFMKLALNKAGQQSQRMKEVLIASNKYSSSTPNDIRSTKSGGSSFMQKQSVSDLNGTLDYGNVLNGSMLLESIKEEEARQNLGSSSARNSNNININNSLPQ